MKIRVLIFETKLPGWVQEARAEYIAKITPFTPLEVRTLKGPRAERDDAELKRRKEGEVLLKNLDARDFLILFDEAGRSFPNSEAFAQHLSLAMNSGKPSLVFVIGGPYGFSEDVKKRAQAKWSLSGLTFNHWLAQLVALEQIYRGFTIIKRIPYHNR